jgi:hypothetical protein
MNNNEQVLKNSYFKLKTKLLNPGFEVTMRELMWNDAVYDEIDILFKDINPDLVKLIKKNHV